MLYQRIPLGHVEAGLRTWDKQSPFPEEANRVITDQLARGTSHRLEVPGKTC